MSDKHKGRRAPLVGRVERVEVGGGYGYKAKRPFVELVVNDQMVQMTPAKARQIGTWLLVASEQAEADGFVVEWLATDLGGFSDEDAAKLLNSFRAYREEQRRAQQAHDHPPTESA